VHSLRGVHTKSPAYELTQCVACGSRESHEIADADDVRREVEQLWAFHGKRLRPATPPERLMDRVAFSEHPPFRIVECERCGLVYRNPIERAYELDSIYADATPTPDLCVSCSPRSRSGVGVASAYIDVGLHF